MGVGEGAKEGQFVNAELGPTTPTQFEHCRDTLRAIRDKHVSLAALRNP